MEPTAAPTGESRHTLPEAEANTKHAFPPPTGHAEPASPVSTHRIDTIGLWSAQALNLHRDWGGQEVSQRRKVLRGRQREGGGGAGGVLDIKGTTPERSISGCQKGGGIHAMHARSRMTTKPSHACNGRGRSTPSFHRPGRHCHRNKREAP